MRGMRRAGESTEGEVGKEDGEQLSRQRAYDDTEADTHIALMDACSRCHTDEPMMQQATVHTHLRMIVRACSHPPTDTLARTDNEQHARAHISTHTREEAHRDT